MPFIIRPLDENDYEDILKSWWEQWGWQPPEKDFLPEEGKGGIMVMDGEEPVCAGFMYATNSKVAWVDWIISSKTYRGPKRKEALKTLVHTLTNVCKNSGYKYSYALIKHPSLLNTYVDLGYIKGDGYTGELIKVL